jgi:toxin ParE1/3/4
MPRIQRTDQANEDLIEILTAVGRYSPAAADRLADEIERGCQIHAAFPLMGSNREQLAPGLRSFAIGKYVIFYKPLDDGIEIIRVLFGRRDFPPLFKP